jgi:hypothetical protein
MLRIAGRQRYRPEPSQPRLGKAAQADFKRTVTHGFVKRHSDVCGFVGFTKRILAPPIVGQRQRHLEIGATTHLISFFQGHQKFSGSGSLKTTAQTSEEGTETLLLKTLI